MKNFIDLKLFTISLTVCGVIALGVSYFSGLSFWVTFGIAVVALLVNGVIVTFEDELPGGLKTTNGKSQEKGKD